MPIAASVKEIMNNKGSSVIRKMFEEGIALKAKYGEDTYSAQKDYSLNRLAEIVEENLDMDIIDRLIFD